MRRLDSSTARLTSGLKDLDSQLAERGRHILGHAGLRRQVRERAR
jgi:hypothetical protein